MKQIMKYIPLMVTLLLSVSGILRASENEPMKKQIIGYVEEENIAAIKRLIENVDSEDVNRGKTIQELLLIFDVLSDYFDVNKALSEASLNVEPGGGYPSGVDPKSIKDVKIREEYGNRLKDNSANIFQKHLMMEMGKLSKLISEALNPKN